MKKILKNREAISPVTAAIAVIVGMVAIAIVVAVLVGSIAANSIAANKELTVTGCNFAVGDFSSGRITVHVNNPATIDVTVSVIKVNDANAVSWSSGSSNTIVAGASETFTITQAISAGTPYSVNMYDSDGTLRASYTGTA